MKIRYTLNAFATAVSCMLLAASCTESDSSLTDSTEDKLEGDVAILISPTIEAVDDAEDFSTYVYTSEKLIFYAWLKDSGEAVVTADEYRYTGASWISDSGNIYADNFADHTFFGYVTGTSTDVTNYKAMSYNHGDGDLLYALKTVAPQRAAVDMDLVHAMAQLSVQFTLDGYRTDETISLTLPDLAGSVTMDLTQAPAQYTLSNSADYVKNIDVTPDTVSARVTDIVIPQTLSEIEIYAYDTEVTLTPEAPIELEAGKRTLITINITKNDLVEVTMGSLSIEPWDNAAEEVTFDTPIVVGE